MADQVEAAFTTDEVLAERAQMRDELEAVATAAEALQAEYEQRLAAVREEMGYEQRVGMLREQHRAFHERALFLDGMLTGRGVPLDTPIVVGTNGQAPDGADKGDS